MSEQEVIKRLVEMRVVLLREYPFYGRLLQRLRFGLDDCNTAYTDMRRIVFDPHFAARISDTELKSVVLHELLHCALCHCTRGIGKQHFIYNVACDIVVNSILLEMLDQRELYVDQSPLMHLAPNGDEGREHTAESVYSMLMELTPKEFDKAYGGGGPDDHSHWEELEDFSLEELWRGYLREASAAAGKGSGIPSFLERYLKEVESMPRTNWRQVLHDFIQFEMGDYSYAPPDKRFDSDIILPSFGESIYNGIVERLWFLIDTSGSVSDEAVSVAFEEIRQAMNQIGRLSGLLSYFDYTVSEPAPFESVEELQQLKPIGGGGTNFAAIFEKLAEMVEEGNAPVALAIITDGYDDFPPEEAALGIPVIWIIVDSEVVPPWGVYAHIQS